MFGLMGLFPILCISFLFFDPFSVEENSISRESIRLLNNYSIDEKTSVANRSEIAVRIFRSANELNLRTVAIYAEEDRFGVHRFKADEAYLVGQGKGPVAAYLDIESIISIAKAKNVDMIHPGYGFLVRKCSLCQSL